MPAVRVITDAVPASPALAPTASRSAWAVMCSVAFALYLRELKTRLGGQWWGALWALGEPLANTVVMLLVYGALRAHSIAGVDTLIFLISGLLPFALFKSLALRLMEAIDANQGLFAYRQVKPIDAVLSRGAVELSLAIVLMLLTTLGLAWSGHTVIPRLPLELLATSGVLVAFGSALGLLFAVVTSGPFARARSVVRVAFFPLYLASGVVFPLGTLPQAAQQVLLMNPLAHLLECLRSAFFGPLYHAPENVTLLKPLGWTLVITLLSLSLYRVRRDQLQAT